MRTHRPRRTARLLALAAAAALTVVGCTSEPGTPASTSGSMMASPSAPAGLWLTAQQLMAATLPDADVPNSHGNPVVLRRPKKADPRIKPPSDPACGRLFDATNARQPVTPAATVADQTFNWKGDFYGSGSVLASYEGSGAQEAFTQVRDSLSACRSYEQEGPAGPYKATVTAAPAPRLGDEAVQYEITIPTEAGPHVTQYTVVRTGKAVATFRKASDGQEGRAFPPAVIAQQITLLQQAQG